MFQGAAPAATTPALTLAQAQEAQISVIDAAYAAAVAQNVTFKTAGGVTEAFEADAGSQTLLMQATQGYGLAGETPSGFYWVGADNTHVPFALADLEGLYQAILAQGWAAFQRRQTLRRRSMRPQLLRLSTRLPGTRRRSIGA